MNRNFPSNPSLIFKITFLLLLLRFLLGCGQPTDMNSYLTALHEEGKLNGNILVMKNDSLLYEGSFGSADASKTINLTRDHRFNIGSIYKEFPAVAIMELQEKGKLHLDDKINLYVQGLSEEAKIGFNIQAPLGYCDWKDDEIKEHVHHGSSASYETLVKHYTEDKLMIILLTNQKQGNLYDIADTLYDLAI